MMTWTTLNVKVCLSNFISCQFLTRKTDDFIEEEDGDKSSWITPPNDRLKFERTGETDEQLAMFYDKKYGRYNNTRANIVDIPQPVLLPHNGDPDLFFVKCKV